MKCSISADISKAYHQMIIKESERNYMRILWFDTDGKLITLRLARIPFGTSSAPFTLFATIKKHLDTHSNSTARDMLPCFYSDNLVTSKDENALEFCLAQPKSLVKEDLS